MALYPLVRPLAFALDAERAHRLTIRALRLLPGGAPAKADPALSMQVAGLDFPNPVGLAAGFDKDAEVFRQMLGLGFGFVEVGTVTPVPRPAIQSRGCSGWPRTGGDQPAWLQQSGRGGGAGAAGQARPARRAGRRQYRRQQGQRRGDAAIADYCGGVRAMLGVADYLTVNISSPNTPGLRGLQDKAALDELLAAVIEARGAAQTGGPRPPVFLKVAPDLDEKGVGDIARVAMDRKVDALIVANTTVSRPMLLSRHRGEAGGLSGAPLKALALERLRDFRRATGGALPLIAVGGIENGVVPRPDPRRREPRPALHRSRLPGAGSCKEINRELKRLMARHGFARLTDAVGTERPLWLKRLILAFALLFAARFPPSPAGLRRRSARGAGGRRDAARRRQRGRRGVRDHARPTVVEPQSSGIGGGGFLLYHDGTSRASPAMTAARPRRTRDAGLLSWPRRPALTRDEAIPGGLSVGVPAISADEMAHERHGRLAWARLFGPAIRLARDGFAITPRMRRALAAPARLPA